MRNRVDIIALFIMIGVVCLLTSCVTMPKDYVGLWSYSQLEYGGRKVCEYDLREDGTFTLREKKVARSMRSVKVKIDGEWRLEESEKTLILTLHYDIDSYECNSDSDFAEMKAEFVKWNDASALAESSNQVYGWPVLRIKGSTMLLGHNGNTIRLNRLRCSTFK